jgi:hypothetical protein
MLPSGEPTCRDPESASGKTPSKTTEKKALTVTGYTMTEGGGSKPEIPPTFPMPEGEGPTPAFPPTLVLNDYIAGYLGAAGVIAALRRRAMRAADASLSASSSILSRCSGARSERPYFAAKSLISSTSFETD